MTRHSHLSQRPVRRISKALSLLAIVALFSVCIKAFNKVGYNTLLPPLVLQRIDAFFDLNTTQENYLKVQIYIHHKWHKTTQLKLYLADLKDLRQRFAAGLKTNDLDWLTARLTLHRNALFSRVLPDIAQVLQTLSEAQIQHFEKKLAKENRELAAKLARPLSVRQEEEFTKVIEQVEDWAGKITEGQRQILRARYLTLPDGLADWLHYREEQQAVFVRLLRSRPDRKTLVRDLEERMLYQERNVPKRFRASFTRTLSLLREMVLTGDRLLSPEQRTHALRKTDEYIQLIAELAD